jgi:hypothetical protein
LFCKIYKVSLTNLVIVKLEINFVFIFLENNICSLFSKKYLLIPFCVSIYDGKIISSYYLSDYKNSEELIISALTSIMVRKYNGYNIYIHNIAKFDKIFLFKYLVKLGPVKPIIHNGRIISINFNFGNKYSLHFKDSYLLLLSSLRKLTKSFNVEIQKSIFPYFFVNENNLNYIGEVPNIKYFNKINKTDYKKYKNNFNNN